MAHMKAAFKAIRQTKKRHLRNISIKSELKTINKKFNDLITAKDIEKAKSLLKSIIAKFDKAASNGIIHKNTANRKKARLSKALAKLVKK